MKMKEMRKEYIKFLPVCSRRTADMLKREALWEVFETIRSSGMKGVTVKEIVEKIREPVSTVYNAINQLEREGYIHGMKPSKLKAAWGHRRKTERLPGKTPKRYFEACEKKSAMDHREEGERDNPWGDVIFYDTFFHEIGHLIEKEPGLAEVREKVLDFVENFYKSKILYSNSKIKKLLPDKEICPYCNRSHEGYEFFKAIILYMATKQILDTKKFDKFLKKLGFKE